MEAFGEKNLPTSFANSSTVVMESVVCESILISMAVQCDVTTFNHVLIAMATEMLSGILDSRFHYLIAKNYLTFLYSWL